MSSLNVKFFLLVLSSFKAVSGGRRGNSAFLYSLLEQFQQELDRFLKLPKLNHENCPFEWYRVQQENFFLLSEIATALLSIPPTSVSSERLFSKAGLIYGNKLRNRYCFQLYTKVFRLSEERAEECLLIKANQSYRKQGVEIESEEESDVEA